MRNDSQKKENGTCMVIRRAQIDRILTKQTVQASHFKKGEKTASDMSSVVKLNGLLAVQLHLSTTDSYKV